MPPPSSGRSTLAGASLRRESGLTLVALVVAITVMNILVAAALQPWSQYMQRERERELIFRGLQYAEAIRVYQLRFGRLPSKLEELVENEPRSIRQLWTDPMTEDGEWDLILAQDTRALRAPNAGNRDPNAGLGSRARREAEARAGRGSGRSPRDGDRGGDSLGLGGELARELGRVSGTTGPIIGVKSKSTDESILVFMEQEQHDLWEFTSDLLSIQAVAPGNDALPRLTAAWVGRPFRDGLTPAQLPLGGGGPGGVASPTEQPLNGSGLEDAFRGNSSRGSRGSGNSRDSDGSDN